VYNIFGFYYNYFLHLHHATKTNNMQKLERLFKQLSEKERSALVLMLCTGLGVHKTTVYRWASGVTKPAHELILNKATQIIEDYALERTIKILREAGEARRNLN